MQILLTINSYRWLFLILKRIHGDKLVKPSRKYDIVEETSTSSKLIIHDVTLEDESPVCVKVKNLIGETDSTAQLKILGVHRKNNVSPFFQAKSFVIFILK